MYLFSGQENKRIEQIIYGMVFFIIAVNMIIYVLTDLSVLLEKRYDLFIMLGIFILISISIETYNQKRCDNIVFNRIFSCISCIFKRISEVFFISFICAIFSYFTTAFNFPMQDEMFNGWDRALGFDWLYWFEFTKSHPVIAEILCFAYQAILPQTIWIMPLLVVLGRYKEAQLLFFSFFRH